ncbi:probable ATP-binding protein YheS [Eucalyptus grandis]|uniref:probable ATP-binding protein YheS n=1 Tax=Eucalyptus grandis TaxID=71139 RepID=UPI00192EEC6C|nr:probable ATP-binding protein YheS [Eucalyptus grandis]
MLFINQGLDAVETLIQGLVLFQGGILMVSHDEHLISGSVDELWVISQGKVAPFHGNFQDHKKILQSSLNQASLALVINQECFNMITSHHPTKHRMRLCYREKTKKDEERIAADIQDVLTTTAALVCHFD